MVVTTNTPASNSPARSRRTVLIVLAVVGVLLAALIGVELYARHEATSCLSAEFEREVGSAVDVDLSAQPILLQVLRKHYPYVGIHSDNAAFGSAVGMKLSARAADIDLADGTGRIGSSSADIDWSTAGIQQTMQQQPFGSLVSEVRAGNDGTLTFAVGGLADLVVAPSVSGGTVQVNTRSAQVLGIGLPTDLVDGVAQTIATSLQTYPLGMTAQQIDVDTDGIHLKLAGGSYQLQSSEVDTGLVCGQRT
ncbi:LmeA family phospholipid-binding protein [Skermania piniformis]|uniref:DUF2993 domain-containing protein n=1 Tax=Skermania pinensis TaxID=39122 RepID=A0ABX8SBH1_9ACTN|nr:LmeA family phospholipid-binding protein [Skermania piniformis]QXQ14344.1 DUF2993 domain-containing protein [Skermania piniformis]